MDATATATLARPLSLLRLRRSHAHARVSFPSTAAPAPRDVVHPFRRATSDAADLVLLAATSSASLPELLRSPRSRILEEEDAAPMAHGAGLGAKGGGGGGGGGAGGGQSGMGMGEHYRRVLRVEPDNPLLLRNYGRYLHDVERHLAGAEEYYARALLAAPADADAELLSLYGRVLWEAGRDKERASAYLERAVQAAPDDSYVLGSYASFLWDADADEEEEAAVLPSPELVPAC